MVVEDTVFLGRCGECEEESDNRASSCIYSRLQSDLYLSIAARDNGTLFAM